jgi:tetratricopeptide (TPR) repeat protein
MADSDDDWDIDMSTWKPAAGNQFSSYDAETVIKELKQHPFFMTDVDEGNEEMTEAIKALLYDGTPEEIAANFKRQGNEAFEEKKWRDALQFYTSGLQVKCNVVDVDAALHSNRAAVQLQLGNYREAWKDAVESCTLRPSVKGWFRAAKASFAVDKLEKAMDALHRAQELDSTSEAVKQEIVKVEARIKFLQEKKEKEQAAIAKKLVEQRAILDALAQRKMQHISTGVDKEKKAKEHPLNGLINTPHDSKIFVDPETQNIVIPTLFLYPQYQTSDFIQEFNEGHEFGDHLAYMFGVEAPPVEWDLKKEYRPDTLDVYYEHHNDPNTLYRVYTGYTLGDIARHVSFAIRDGVAVFFIVPRTKWGQEFTGRYKKVLNYKP